MPYIGKTPASVPVTSDDIPNNSITSAKILDNVITIADIGPNAVGSSEMADDAVGLNELSAGGTTNTTTFLRGDNSWAVPPNTVYTHPNHSGDVTSTADGATVIGNNKVITDKILNSNVTTAKIADDAVTAAKLANSINTDIATGVTGNTTANAALPKAGGTVTGNVNFNDSSGSSVGRLTIGTGNDLQIYHNGSHSYIEDNGTGNLHLLTNHLSVNSADDTEAMIHATQDAGVSLFHNNVKKIETSAAGVTVSGKQDINKADTTFATNGSTSYSAATLKIKTHSGDSTVTTFGGITGGTGYIQRSNGGGSGFYPLALNPYGGKVGIGTTAPYTALHIKSAASGQSAVNSSYNNFTIENDSSAGMSILTGTSSIGAIVFGDSGDNDIGKIEYAHSGNSMRFTVNAAERMRITDNGTIGIGNTIPNTFSANASNLVVGSGTGSQGITIYSGSGSAGNIFFADSADNNEETRGGVSYQHNGNKMQFRVNDANRVTINTHGLLGLGAEPAANVMMTISSDGSSSNQPGIKFIDTNSGNDHQIYTNAGDLFFRDTTRGVTTAVIKNDGKVGIGSTSPARTLHVKSPNANVASFEGHQGEGLAVSSGTNGQIDLIGYDDGASSYNAFHLRAASAGGIFLETDGSVIESGMKTVTHSFSASLNQALTFDIPIANIVNYFEIKAIMGYYPGTDYTASIHGFYAYRSDSGISRVVNFNDASSNNSGSFTVTNTSTTNIRVTKVAGSASAGARGFVQVKFRYF